MAMSKRKRRLEAKKKRQAKQFWRILILVTLGILILLYIMYMNQ